MKAGGDKEGGAVDSIGDCKWSIIIFVELKVGKIYTEENGSS